MTREDLPSSIRWFEPSLYPFLSHPSTRTRTGGGTSLPQSASHPSYSLEACSILLDTLAISIILPLVFSRTTN